MGQGHSRSHKKNLIFSLHITPIHYSFSPAPLHCFSAKSPAQILHPAHKPRGDARRQRQPDVRGRGLAHAVPEVDHGPGGADQGGGDAAGTQRAGGHQHPPVGQLHLRGHVVAGRDRGHGSGHRQR